MERITEMQMQTAPTEEQKSRYGQAVDALNRGDWKQAQKLAMDLVREVPPHGGVYFVAGGAARELMQIPLALQCLQRAVELNPARPDYLAQFARALSQASEPRIALEMADRAAALGPSDPVSLDTLGVV
jgi:predicted Zn-dependent protease